jgi:hypothetical protein
MAVIRVNPPGLPSTSEGYISSITIRTNGGDSALVPDPTTGQVTVSAAAATQLIAISKNQMVLVSN